jgi:hypothetical protein
MDSAAYDAWVQRAKCRGQQPCIAVIESRIFRRVGLTAELLSNPLAIASQLTSRHNRDHVAETSRNFPAPSIGSQAQHLYLPIFNKHRIGDLTLFQSPTITNHHKTHRFPRAPNCGSSSQPSSGNIYDTPTQGVKRGIQDTTSLPAPVHVWECLNRYVFNVTLSVRTCSVGTVSGLTTAPLHFSQPPGEAHGKLCLCH